MTSAHVWTSEAKTLLHRAIESHGGRDRWLAARSIRLPFVRGSGPLLALKGFEDTFPAPREYEVQPHEHVALFHGYPDADHVGRFDHGDVTIARVGDGQVVSASASHRRTLSGFAKHRRWTPLDALYFFGYALVHYHSVPFTLGAARLVGIVRRHDTPIGLEVEFSPELHLHSRRQRFYFGADGRIVRHDYRAEVIGLLARGAHYWEDYERVGGLLIARRRRVVLRIGRWPTPLVVLDVQLGQPAIDVKQV